MGFIDRPQKVWWRKAIFQIHLWVGIFLALYVIFICLSGCVLIFGDEITDDAPQIPSHEIRVNPLALDSAAAAARSLHADYRLVQVEVVGKPGKASLIEMQKRVEAHGRREITNRNLYFDPSTGRIISDLNPDGRHPIYRFIDNLHADLLLGSFAGRQINAVCAALLLLLCLTGIVIWWPGRRRWKQAIGVRWSGGWKRINFDSHSAIGFWTLSMISIWAITGVYFGYPQPIQNALANIMPFGKDTPLPKTTWKVGARILPLATLYQHGKEAVPEQQIQYIIYPSQTGDPVYVFFSPNRSPHYLDRSSAFLNPENGDLLRIKNDWKEGRVGDRLLHVLSMLHFTKFDSLSLRIVFALLGFAPIVLTVTGALMWWNRVLSKRWKQMRKTKREGISQHESETSDLVFPPIGRDGLLGQSSSEHLSLLDDGRS